MPASKDRLRWAQLPAAVQRRIEDLVGGPVVAAENCAGGFSPGLAARLRLAGGGRAFVKAVDSWQWPTQAPMHRSEARVATVLPPGLPAPRFIGSHDDGRWVILAFECVEGAEPPRPWRHDDLERVVAAAGQLGQADASGLASLPRAESRLGGWSGLAADNTRLARLAARVPWAAGRLPMLIALEEAGMAAAQGNSLMHSDMYAHNILLTADRVLFVDWPWARLGAPGVDLVILLASAAGDGIDPEPFLAASPLTAGVSPAVINGLLAAHAGFCMGGGLWPPLPGLEPIHAAKLKLGLASLGWLQRRLG
jgi:Phosphotransferase enzyme family